LVGGEVDGEVFPEIEGVYIGEGVGPFLCEVGFGVGGGDYGEIAAKGIFDEFVEVVAVDVSDMLRMWDGDDRTLGVPYAW